MQEVIIVGAGLSGLTAAYYLKKAGIRALVLEARPRSGGRVLTVAAPGRGTPVEMGATWFADKHLYFMQLVRELGLPLFKQLRAGIEVLAADPGAAPQYYRVPPSEEASYRVAGGTGSVIEALAGFVGQEQIVFNACLAQVTDHRGFIEIVTRQGDRYTCRHLVLTIPPALILSQKICFDPILPAALVQVMADTHTWMGEAIKFAVEYESPFWRRQGFSGAVFSPGGLVPEIYDHTNHEETRFALKGFLAPEAAAADRAKRQAMVLAQLVRIWGREAAAYLSYTEKVWGEDVFTYAAYSRPLMPHQHNGHPLYGRPLMQGRLLLAGTETSPCFGGYMDGAVYGGLAAARHVLRRPQQSENSLARD